MSMFVQFVREVRAVAFMDPPKMGDQRTLGFLEVATESRSGRWTTKNLTKNTSKKLRNRRVPAVSWCSAVYVSPKLGKVKEK